MAWLAQSEFPAIVDLKFGADRTAYLRGAIAKGGHTADEASLAEFLKARMAANGIHLDMTVSLEH